MDEHVNRMCLKEEEFLEVYYETVDAVLPSLGHAWRPCFLCNDHVRDRRARLLAMGQLAELTFDSAVMFHGRDGLSSIRLYLRSSARFVVTRIHWAAGETRVEMLADNERCGAAARQAEPRLRASCGGGAKSGAGFGGSGTAVLIIR